MSTRFRRRLLFAVLLGTAGWLGFDGRAFCAAPLAPLKVSSSGRHLVMQPTESSSETPFFWLADTAWELFHRLDRDGADRYLQDRATKGFTVIQAVVLAEEDGLRVPNANGDLPLANEDPTKPIEAYFQHVDYIVGKANGLGLRIAMLPTWGDKVTKAWGKGPVIFNEENARAYGIFLGQRYQDAGIIWVLGGDRSPIGYESIWRAMAEGLRAGDDGRHLITGHFSGGSAQYFHNEPWLDFNFAYSGHAWAAPNYQNIGRDYQRRPVKPTIDGEPRYDNHPYLAAEKQFYSNRKAWDGKRRAGAQQMRQAAYWAMLAGAAGHTYGAHDIWQMYDPDRGVPAKTFANTPWHKAIDFPGSQQMGIMRRMFESFAWQKLVPDQSIIADGQGLVEHHAQAARAADGTFAVVYVPMGDSISIRMDAILGDQVTARWFNPRNGNWTRIGRYENRGTRQFTPPSHEASNHEASNHEASSHEASNHGKDADWVLTLKAHLADGHKE